MEQPNEQETRQFWKQLGWTNKKHPNGSWFMWYSSKGKFYDNAPPKINVGSLCEYAIPKLQNEGYQVDIVCSEQKGFRVRAMDAINLDGKVGVCEDDDLSLALFGAINQVIK